VDETSRSLYSDVFGIFRTSDATDEEIDRRLYGEVESDSSNDKDEDEEWKELEAKMNTETTKQVN
jgi:hypothetical protein